MKAQTNSVKKKKIIYVVVGVLGQTETDLVGRVYTVVLWCYGLEEVLGVGHGM